jgi:deoxyribodipyrimidine photo-lyase
VQAALLIGDENPCREPERWRRVLAKRLKLPYWTVDADVVVPSSRLRPELCAAASLQAAFEG